MVKRIAGFVVVVAWASFQPALAFNVLRGPRLYNATSHEILLRVTFSDGYTWPVPMAPLSGAAYTEAAQVTALNVEPKGGNIFYLSGEALPRVPADLIKPSDQMWIMDEKDICVRPERLFHDGVDPKC